MERKRTRGKRGGISAANAFLRSTGQDDRPSALRKGMPVAPVVGTNMTKVAGHAAIFYGDSEAGMETEETHLIPRQSLTQRYFLGAFPQQVETEVQATATVNATTGEITEVQKRRIVWRSDRTLLRKGSPFGMSKDIRREGTIRHGQHSRKFINAVPGDTEQMEEKLLGPAVKL